MLVRVLAPNLPDIDIVDLIGEGAFGSVYRARQVSLNRPVAVKVFKRTGLGDPDDRARFVREARILARLDCPSIVKVYDLVEQADDLSIVMELVEGPSLAELMRIGPLDQSFMLMALTDVAAALQQAAAAGVVHRDVKPANILVGRDGHAKLGDFGLSRIQADPQVFQTVPGLVRGTPALLAPELISGGVPDERSDAYAFAVTTYLAWVGRLPLEGVSVADLLAAHRDAEPLPPSVVMPGVGPEIDAVLLRGLSKEPACRYLPRELVNQLRQVPPEAWAERLEGWSAEQGVSIGTNKDWELASAAGLVSPLAKNIGTRPRRRWRELVVAGGLGAAVGAILLLAGMARQDLAVLAVNGQTAELVPQCPATRLYVRATIVTNGNPGPLRLQWLLPSSKTEEIVTQVSRGQTAVPVVLELDLPGAKPEVGSVRLAVLEPDMVLGPETPIPTGC